MRLGSRGLNRMISYFRGRAEVSALYVFGARKGQDSPRREACLGVLVDESLLAGGDFDSIVEDCSVLGSDVRDVVLLNQAEPYVKYHIIRKGSLVFEKDPGHRVRFTEAAVREFFDFYTPAGAVSSEADLPPGGEGLELDL
jgi:hypothetical protein